MVESHWAKHCHILCTLHSYDSKDEAWDGLQLAISLTYHDALRAAYDNRTDRPNQCKQFVKGSVPATCIDTQHKHVQPHHCTSSRIARLRRLSRRWHEFHSYHVRRQGNPDSISFVGATDLSKAFDKMAWIRSIAALTKMGLPNKNINPLKDAWKSGKARRGGSLPLTTSAKALSY